jgi:iron complex outermembrane receptor protein
MLTRLFRRMPFFVLVASAAVLSFVPASAWARQNVGVAGRVLDASGAVVARATLTLMTSAHADKQPRVTTTDDAGQYRFTDVPPGSYVLVATSTGFSPATITIAVTAGEMSTADFTLEPAGLNETVTVSVTRRNESLTSIPGAITVVSGNDVRQQMQLTNSLPDALGNLVPGLAPGSQSQSVFGQNLRGRRALVLIDGIPQATTRNVSRDLSTIDAAAIERVEVIRGATALYGDGATGGVINIVTKRPADGAAQFTTDVSFNMSLTHAADSPGANVRQTVSGRRGAFDYVVGASLDHVGSFFDAEGDRIPPDPHRQGGPADTNAQSVFGKLGVAPARDQQLQLSVNYFTSEQSTEYTNDPSVSALPPGTQKARTIRGLSLDDPEGTDNTNLSLDYVHRNFGGQRLQGQLYYRDYLTVFFPSDGRAFASQGHVISQSRLDSRKIGGRFNVEVPSRARALPALLAGIDVSDESTEQPVSVMDAAAYDASGGLVFRKVGDRVWVPRIDLQNVGLFVQADWALTSKWEVRAGLRHERASASVDDFTTLAGARASGGTIKYDDTHYNAGVVFHPTTAVQIFGNFAQGFSLPDIGLVLRGAPNGASVATLPLEAQKVDMYEIGARGQWRVFAPSVAVFYNTSELGTSSAGFNQPVVRAPERVHGAEATLDVRPGTRLSAGGSISWLEGKHDPNRDDIFTYLNSWRIPPVKATSYLEFRVLPRWQNRLQLLYSGDRNRFGNSNAFGERPVESYTTLDWLSAFETPKGTLRVGIQNLLNNQYFLRDSQLLRVGGNLSYAAAQGAVVSVAYSLVY